MNATTKAMLTSVLGACAVILSATMAQAQKAGIDAPAAIKMPEQTILSPALRFEGEVVDVLPTGEAIRTDAFMRGRHFSWMGKFDGRVAEEEETDIGGNSAPDIDDLSLRDLAEHLRGVALYNGHLFVETDAPIELAIQMKQLRALELSPGTVGDLEKLLPGTSGSQGKADSTPDLGTVEDGETGGRGPRDKGAASLGAISRIVHGADDRRVMNNLIYPHRTHIVFDNTGSTSSINGSQGSGTLIGPSTAMSVAHVFWHEANNTWEADHRWAPGYDSNDADPSPWGEWYRCYWVTIPFGYVLYESTSYDYAVLDFDVGCNSVRNGVNSDNPGSTVGWLGHYTASASAIESRTGYMRGYPANGTCGNPGTSCNVRVWGDRSSWSENDALSTTIRHQADSTGGQSGSAFYHYADPSCSGCGYGAYLVGMHRAGAPSYNQARRFTSSVLSFMRAYSSDY